MKIIALAAAVILIALFVVQNSLQNNVTYAKVVQPILNARAITYDILSNSKGSFTAKFHDIVIGRKIRRTTSLFKMDVILDFDNSQVLGLDPINKSAAFWSMDPKKPVWQIDFMGSIRSLVSNAINDPLSSVEEIGREKINGLDVVGFRFNPGTDENEIIIWADPATALPIQIDVHAAYSNLETAELLYTIENIEFDVPVEESLVSMELPHGYTLHDKGVFEVKLYENDFFKLLQIWIKSSPNGVFPDELNDAFFEQMLRELMKSRYPKEREGIPRLALGFGLFLTGLENSGADTKYSGDGVQFGDGDKEIFRYRTPDSQTWRVVYGDSHIEDDLIENPAR